MRILFVMHYPGYMRYFDSTLAELADRGHEILVSFESPHKQPEGLEALERLPASVKLVDPLPRRAPVWAIAARAIRGTIDYARYLHPELADASYLRGRMEKVLPFGMRWLKRVDRLRPDRLRLFVRGLMALENGLPVSPEIDRFIAEADPDVVLVTPLVVDASPQTDVVKAARARGLPSACCVASWDHLTTKGMVRLLPDRLFVWNEAQVREAVSLQWVPESKVTVTGAQPFDRWFGREPSATQEEFCQKVGLPSDRPFLLFVGSTASISEPEAEERFVRSWIAAIRASGVEGVHDAPVLIRPHPFNMGGWSEADLSDLGHAQVWPRAGANPVRESDRDDYFDSLYHSAAVIGINTSAMVEAAIVGRPVLTVTDGAFAETQGGTVHFGYLTPERGGFTRVAGDLDSHMKQLADVLESPTEAQLATRDFVQTFIRPHGFDRPSTPVLAEEIEKMAGARPEALPAGALPALLRPVTWLIGAALVFSDRGKLAKALRRESRSLARSLRKKAKQSESQVARRGLGEVARLAERGGKRASILLRGSAPPGKGGAKAKGTKKDKGTEKDPGKTPADIRG